ncbi:MAG: ABC transporter substrate-binding protein [Pseudomonadota bacterium]
MVATGATLLLFFQGCAQGPWNDPYPQKEARADTYYSSFTERPKHLDPARSYSSNEWAFISQIYEPPLQYHFLKRPYVLEPQTAVAMPELVLLDENGAELPAHDGEPAFSEYRVRIRPGILYQPHPALAREPDGSFVYTRESPQVARARTLADFDTTGTREVVAADYAYQIKRLAVPWNSSPIAGLMGGYILGFREFAEVVTQKSAAQTGRKGRDRPWLDLRDIPMQGVEVLDRYSFRIRIKGRYPQFIYWLAMNFFAPMPWEAERFHHLPGFEERNITLDWYPIGTGPYMLVENNPNLRMVLARNPNFQRETYPTEGGPGDAASGLLDDAGRPLPLVSRAVYSLEKESIPRWNKFLQGYYDVSGIGSDSFDQAVQFGSAGEAELTPGMEAKGIQLETAVETSVVYLGFNMRDPVVGGDSERARLLRQAISIAIDYEEYISIFRNGRGLAAQGPLPPGIFGHREGSGGINPVVYDDENGEPVRRSIADARALLARAGYPGGIDPDTGETLVLYYDNAAAGPDSKAQLAWYRKQFQKLGIQLVIRATDYNRFQEKMRKGTAQIFTWGWNADYPDPENFFFLLYSPNAKVLGEGENAANYENPEFDNLFDRMKNMPNGIERQQIIDRMTELLQHDAPWAWGFFPVDFVLHHDWYGNAKPNLMANNTLKYKRIDGDLRAVRRDEWNDPVTWPLWLAVLVFLVSLVPGVVLYRRRERSAAR